ncbi:hypothetical protein C6497_04270 [Candidatus Poribacteria bacterium]|nr:MAG: hypothetical protein C6497_04270 [Candidatus Poribacteria bacterium]
MNTTKLRSAVSKSKDLTLGFLGRILTNTRIEPIHDDTGVRGLKASWVGEQGDRSYSVDTDDLNANIEIDSDETPTVEYVHSGETRSVAIKNISNISCTVDNETLDKFTTPRGAAIAVCAGAAAGLVSWFAISVIRSLAEATNEQIEQSITAIPSEEADSSEEQIAVEE